MNRPATRIQRRNRAMILEAALDEFSARGFDGATLDLIARSAGLSKPNLLYYFASKEAIYDTLLSELLANWLDPMRLIGGEGEPIDQIVAYVLKKLELSRQFPRESRLFAREILSGAPRFLSRIEGELRATVDEKVDLIRRWQREGQLAALDPYHLIFSIWATTQHYADFDIQVRSVLDRDGDTHFSDAGDFLASFYRRALRPA